jgi:arsenite-transporting ATPase
MTMKASASTPATGSDDGEGRRGGPSFIAHLSSFLKDRRIVLVGGKGGVGKTTIACAIALHRAHEQKTILFTTDPASNLADIFKPADARPNLTIEALDAATLYARFLEENLESFLELGDRGTYLEKDELRRFFELSLPGVDELMAWLRIGELAEANPEAAIIVDTAPTGHTLRMLGGGEHFQQLGGALDAMQEKHRGMVRQFTRRDVRDAMDVFIERFTADATRRHALLTSPASAFVPVFLAEPWVIEQTKRLIAEVRSDGFDVPVAVLNRSRPGVADSGLGVPIVKAEESPSPLDTPEAIESWSGDSRSTRILPAGPATSSRRAGTSSPATLTPARLTFFAGKGGVGKTTLSAATALMLARRSPDQRVTVISVDPAHSLRYVFAQEAPPANLAVETIDTKAKWATFRDDLGDEIERAVSALAPRGMTVAYEAEAMRKLVEIAPPGADELFAIERLSELLDDDGTVIVDTAPTGHFLRLIDLPKTAGEWVREFMRILLRYKELVPPGSLGEELIRASRALSRLDEAMHSERCTIFVVTRPEGIVIAETKRLIAELEQRGLPIGAVIANYVIPESEASEQASIRARQDEALESLGREKVIVIPRRESPVTKLSDLESLVPSARLWRG